MLMPAPIAALHDHYISQFESAVAVGSSGYREIKREVTAKKKSGALLQVEIVVKAYTRHNGETMFFGFFTDMSRALALHSESQLNDLILDMSPVPMVAIDALGTVVRFNRAAELCFLQASADVVGQNVKVLMPEEIATHHDSYLARYMRTKIKRIVDTTRKLRAVKKNGETFPIELSVKEITTTDLSSISSFLGFIKDLSDDLTLDEANRGERPDRGLVPPFRSLESTLSGTSSNSLARRCRAFGYEAKEVLNHNVKKLMFADDAATHDKKLEDFRHGKRLQTQERRITGKRKNGTPIALLGHIQEIRKEGSPSTLLGFFVELTDVKTERAPPLH